MTFCYILPVESLFQVTSNNQTAYWDSPSLDTAFHFSMVEMFW